MPTFGEIKSVGRTGEYRFDSGQQAFGMDARYEVGWYIQLEDSVNMADIEPRQLLLDDRIPQYLAPYVNVASGFVDPYSLLRYGNITTTDTNRKKIYFTLVYAKLPIDSSSATPNSPLQEVFPGAAYPTGGPSGGSGDASGDLTQLAPRFTYGSEVIDEVFRTDNDGNLVVNTASDLFETQPTRPTLIRVLRTTRYETEWDEDKWDRFAFVTNSTFWRGRIDGQCLMLPPEVGDYVLLGGTLFYPVTYTIKIKIHEPLTWFLDIDSYGFRELKGGKLTAISWPGQGGKVDRPWPLKIDGTALTPAEIDAGDEPHRLSFRKYDAEEFEDLKLILPTGV